MEETAITVCPAGTSGMPRGSCTRFFTARISAIALTAISGWVLAADVEAYRPAQSCQRDIGLLEVFDQALAPCRYCGGCRWRRRRRRRS